MVTYSNGQVVFIQQVVVNNDTSKKLCEGYEMRGGSWFCIPAYLHHQRALVWP
jgi:hypothetical protein